MSTRFLLRRTSWPSAASDVSPHPSAERVECRPPTYDDDAPRAIWLVTLQTAGDVARLSRDLVLKPLASGGSAADVGDRTLDLGDRTVDGVPALDWLAREGVEFLIVIRERG